MDDGVTKKPKRERIRAPELPWDQTAEGVLDRALEVTRGSQFTDVVVIGVSENGKVTVLPFSSSNDRYRIVGIVRWALDRLAGS